MPNYSKELISFDCECKNETDKAWLVVIDEEDYWVPKSIGEYTPRNSDDAADGEIEVPTWWAEKEGLA